MTTEVATKKCPKCGKVKPRNQFYKNRQKADGLEQYCRDCSKAYRATVRNPEVARQGIKRWIERNPEKVLAIQQERRRLIRENFVEDVSPEEVYRRSNGLCGLCGHPVAFNRMVIDHIVPIKRGGKHSYENTQAAHKLCNLRKGVYHGPVE